MSHAYRLLAVALSVASLGTPTQAAITHLSHSRSHVQADSTGYSQAPTYLLEATDTMGGAASTTRMLSASEGTAQSSAISQLSNGSLKAFAAVSSPTASGNDFIAAIGSATFGDSFRAVTGTGAPFAWTPSHQSTFTVNLSGLVNRTGGFTSNWSTLSILILEPGAIDAYARWVQFDDQAALAAWQNRTITSKTYSLAADYHTLVGDFPEKHYTILSNFPATVTFPFTPNQDFDWIIDLGAHVDNSSAGQSITADFANTALVSYAGPAGSTTLSASGVFPGTTPIPEPATGAIIVAGLVVLTLRRNRANHRRAL